MNGLTRRLITAAAIAAALAAGAIAGPASADPDPATATQMANAAPPPVVQKARYQFLVERARLALLYGGSR